MKTVSIHQPHFLPWLGYFNKALHSDEFVWLHSVQYRKNYFQNRCLIKNLNEQPLWLTVPVHASHDTPIDQVTLADRKWRDRVRKTVEMCYRRAPHFATCWPAVATALDRDVQTLDEVNYHTFRAMLELLGGAPPRVVRAAELGATAADPTERLVQCCRALDATHYIAGKGGHNYLDTDQFTADGIEVIWQEFDPAAVRYSQIGDSFLPGLSVLDCLFNEGPSRTREIAKAAWVPATESKQPIPSGEDVA